MHICLTVSIIEVLPKEKKQKEEKTSLIGQVSVDMFPMLTGKQQIYQIIFEIDMRNSIFMQKDWSGSSASLDYSLLSILYVLP